jgi:hypothetical protein
MNLNEVWNSSGNAPAAAEADALARQALDTIRRARRRQIAFLVWTATALSAVTGGAVYAWAARGAAGGAGWAVGLMLAAQWAAFVHFLRRTLAGGRPPLAGDTSIRESLEALRRKADDDRRGLMVVLALYAVFAPLMAAALLHLREAGKMAPHEALSAAVLGAAVIVIGAAVVSVRLFRIVLPRRRRLEALLEQYH